MGVLKNQIIRLIEENANQKAVALAAQYCRARPQDREAIQAGIDIERWLAEACRECLDQG